MHFDCEGVFVRQAQEVSDAAGWELIWQHLGLSRRAGPSSSPIISRSAIGCSWSPCSPWFPSAVIQGWDQPPWWCRTRQPFSRSCLEWPTFPARGKGRMVVPSSRVLGPNMLELGRGEEGGQAPPPQVRVLYIPLSPSRWPVPEAVSRVSARNQNPKMNWT